ncbi:radical S-adenosyl methionine domain-containing protein 2 [Methanomicrobium sp. W14]|uniref:viperin family antiviral radical SAM protein n=1 Tax=Methanomicrobium sp. W14 TaxID=2817839 RepID=UPI001AE56961|nr:viperin family antiviral radical SAM protein [Methanomicrobium sp. W14]MBP2132353.1 radical S-adenosyl methionine domain-containing protein 2 [Methanomicrobium sp. W14]
MLPKIKKQKECVAIRSANWHITSKCNYNCKFCFSQNLKGELKDLKKMNEVLLHLKQLGITKINFVGGEPLMYPHIIEAIRTAKDLGFTTSITTNGSLCNEKLISEFEDILDWIGLSVDSVSEKIERELGRGNGGHLSHIMKITGLIHLSGIKLKVNTTVTRKTYLEDMHEFIEKTDPDRWKIFQFLHVKGQNSNAAESLSISSEEYRLFKLRHQDIVLKNGIAPVFESAEDMVDSYLMINPEGNIFINKNCNYREIPLLNLNRKNFSELVNQEKYISRGGLYDWKREK